MIPAEADAAQRRSSDPESSVWVSANAGAGKTYVLSQRVVRLLLSGVDPQGILCLTYTNAAAAEMAGRVFKELEGLTSMSDAALTERLKVLAPQLDPAAAVARARTLFARTLETPAGLKISTVHAFAAALLRQFPVEADVSSAFALLDDPAREELTDRAVSAVLSEADAHPGGALAKALEAAVPFVADGNFSDALKTLMADRALARWVGEKPDAATLEQDLHRALAILPPPKLAPSVIATHWLIAVAQAMRAVGSKRLDADRLLAIAAAEGEDRDRMFRELLFKTAGGPQRLTYLVPKTEHEAAPDARDMLEAEQNRQLALLPVEQARDVTAATVPLVLLAAEALRRVDSEKRRRGLLDYDDQIDKAVALLRGQSAAAWVRYRLDEGIDHILLDEAQDTSPAQWELLRALTDEFYDGLGARDTPRTLFVVGDEKQSIYSFQGAAPRLFGTEQDSYRARAGNAGAPFRSVSLSHSFRSAPQILEAVDTVFSEPALSEALGGSAVRHAAIKNMSGGVDVWPLFADEAEEMPLAWDAPLDRTSAASGTSRLANAIADQIEEWMVRGPCGGAPITPGGVLILSRKRGPFTRAMNRVLKDRNIPAAGPDRLTVSEHIAVKDMVALARALLSRDDLSLAAVLRSPLFGFSDDALFAVAHGRDGPLLDALSRTEAGRAAKETLLRWERLMRERRPFDAFCQILVGENRRADFAARMGAEAEDALDAFLDLALAFEETGVAAIEPFLMRLSKVTTEIRRSNDGTDGKVRVMTVHGAKGLEADVVFLADVGTMKPRSGPQYTPLPLGEEQTVLALTPKKSDRPPPLAEVENRKEFDDAAEHLRLLYVGMTRAERMLVVCGAYGKKAPGEGTWHARVKAALEPKGRARPGFGEAVLEWRNPADAAPAAPIAVPVPAHERKTSIPPWIHAPLTAFAARPEPIAPSASAGKDWTSAGAGDSRRLPSARYGALVHTLLEADASRTDLVRMALRLEPGISQSEAQQMAQEALAALELPELRGGRTLREVGVIGDVVVPGGAVRRAHGRIDRIQLGRPNLIVDFKTDRGPPSAVQDVPAAYLMQLAIYRALIAPQVTGPVSCAIVWTAAPAFMAVDSALPAVSLPPSA